MASYELIFNDPPHGGDCEIHPANGTAYETEFAIMCKKDFEDKDEPLFYEIASRFDHTRNWTVFHRGKFCYRANELHRRHLCISAKKKCKIPEEPPRKLCNEA